MENCFLKYGMVLEKRSGKKVESKFFLDNVKALASGEGSNCHDSNGYVTFTSKTGGAYDCCTVWVSKAPNTNEGHCR